MTTSDRTLLPGPGLPDPGTDTAPGTETGPVADTGPGTGTHATHPAAPDDGPGAAPGQPHPAPGEPHTATGEPHAATGNDAVRLSVNGSPRAVAPGTTLDVVVAELTSAPSGVAAAVNEAVVPRGRWAATPLNDGDRVEILTAVQGG